MNEKKMKLPIIRSFLQSDTEDVNKFIRGIQEAEFEFTGWIMGL